MAGFKIRLPADTRDGFPPSLTRRGESRQDKSRRRQHGDPASNFIAGCEDRI